MGRADANKWEDLTRRIRRSDLVKWKEPEKGEGLTQKKGRNDSNHGRSVSKQAGHNDTSQPSYNKYDTPEPYFGTFHFGITIAIDIKNKIQTSLKLIVSKRVRAWRLKRHQGINKLL